MFYLFYLGAVKCGRVLIDSAIYFSNHSKCELFFVFYKFNYLAHCKTFQVLTSTEYPASCFVFTDNQTCLVTDLSFREFPGYLKAFYQRKKKLHVEAKGTKYSLGDFVISFITLFLGQSATVKGYLIEVIRIR